MRLHHYEREAIVDRHVTGTAGTGKFQSMLGNVVFMICRACDLLSDSDLTIRVKYLNLI